MQIEIKTKKENNEVLTKWLILGIVWLIGMSVITWSSPTVDTINVYAVNLKHRNLDNCTITNLKINVEYDKILEKMGKMGIEIKLASEEFGTSTIDKIKLKGLLLGIAWAESNLGKAYVHNYDYNCNNWWGIRKVRNDGSYLQCFVDEKSGARTAAKLLKDHYLDEGFTTPEKIANKYVGAKWSKYHQTWINNVYKYYKKICQK
jgi:hypothetical protein